MTSSSSKTSSAFVLQGAAGEAVVMDDDEEEAADGPDPEPLAFPDALPISLVDESLPISKSPHAYIVPHCLLLLMSHAKLVAVIANDWLQSLAMLLMQPDCCKFP